MDDDIYDPRDPRLGWDGTYRQDMDAERLRRLAAQQQDNPNEKSLSSFVPFIVATTLLFCVLLGVLGVVYVFAYQEDIDKYNKAKTDANQTDKVIEFGSQAFASICCLVVASVLFLSRAEIIKISNYITDPRELAPLFNRAQHRAEIKGLNKALISLVFGMFFFGGCWWIFRRIMLANFFRRNDFKPAAAAEGVSLQGAAQFLSTWLPVFGFGFETIIVASYLYIRHARNDLMARDLQGIEMSSLSRAPAPEVPTSVPPAATPSAPAAAAQPTENAQRMYQVLMQDPQILERLQALHAAQVAAATPQAATTPQVDATASQADHGVNSE